jgi:hypothetical protein
MKCAFTHLEYDRPPLGAWELLHASPLQAFMQAQGFNEALVYQLDSGQLGWLDASRYCASFNRVLLYTVITHCSAMTIARFAAFNTFKGVEFLTADRFHENERHFFIDLFNTYWQTLIKQEGRLAP